MYANIHAGSQGIRGNGNPNHWGRGGKGGIGQGRNFGMPLVSIPRGTAVPGLNTRIDTFCDHYYLGAEIARLLQAHHFSCPGSLVHVTDVELLGAAGFKIGHVAELKCAMKKMVGKELDEQGHYRPELYGGIGGRGGHGGQVGGEGGVGEDSVVPPSLEGLFSKIAGGVGGEGGTGGRQDRRPRRRRDEATLQARIQRMLFLPNTDARSTWIVGGIGGMGGNGDFQGGEGGVGEASHIPTGRLSSCTKIFGGIGGGGGTGGCVGGTGGTGRGSAFYELLGHADKKTLTGKPRPLSDLSIHEDLRKRLRQQGFVTVGALFMVTGGDLLKVNGFELGDICALKQALKSLQLE